MDELKDRLEKARNIIVQKKLDALLFFAGETMNDLSSKNTYYFSGFFDSWPHAVLITMKDAVLFTSEKQRAEKECRISVADARKEKVHNYLGAHRIKKIGIDSGFTFGRWKDLRGKTGNITFLDVTKYILALRGKKDKKEIKKISSVTHITKQVLEDVKKSAGLGDEAAILARVRGGFSKHGAETSFIPIIAGDKNSSNIHYFAGNGKYTEVLMADIGARKDFYNSDLTRTFAIKRNRDILRAQKTLESLLDSLADFIHCETTCIEAYNHAKSFLEKEGYRKESFSNFHSLGHGVGLDTHEFPYISPKTPFKSTRLEEGMIFTLEPAIYYKEWFGVRIENMYRLGKNGLVRL